MPKKQKWIQLFALITAVALLMAGFPLYSLAAGTEPQQEQPAVEETGESQIVQPSEAAGNVDLQEEPVGTEAEAQEDAPLEDGSQEETPVEDEAQEDAPLEDGSQEESTPQLMRMSVIDETTVAVDSFADLKAVLEGNVYSYVYLDADITLSGNITLNANRTGLTIDGRDLYTLNEGSSSYTILSNIENLQLTVKNLTIYGLNYYGTFRVNSANVKLSYQNVTYTGPQITYNRYGTAEYIDCSITIRQNSGGNIANEVAEATHVALGGRTSINIPTYTGYSVFWLFNPSQGTVSVLDGADVSVYTAYYCLYTSDGGTPNIYIGKNASLRVESPQGLTYASHTIGALTIDAGGSFINYQTASKSQAALRIVNSLTVKEGATLEVVCPNTDSALSLIRFTTTGAKASFEYPKRVLLYHPSDPIFYFTGTGTLSIQTQGINLWKSVPKGYTDSISNTPDYIWNKKGLQTLSVTASFSTTTVSSISSNLRIGTGNDPVSVDITAAAFNMANARMLVMGSHSLKINSVSTANTSISGMTVGGADLEIRYAYATGIRTMQSSASANGAYSVQILSEDFPLEAGASVGVTSHSKYLKVMESATVEASTASLKFLRVPSVLQFNAAKILPEPQTIGRFESNWTICVEDTRGESSTWALMASIAQPLTGTNGNTLPGALVYIDNAGNSIALSDTPCRIYSGITGSGPYTDIAWSADRGMLVYLAAGQGSANVEYSTTIEWTLQDAP